MSQAAVIVHGGAGSRFDTAASSEIVPALEEATAAAWKCLQENAPAEIAVVAALKVLEDCEYLDAGYGSFPNENDQIFVDAALMRGCGDYSAFMNIPRVRFPSEIALQALKPGARVQRVWTESMDLALRQSSAEFRARVGLAESHAALISPHARAVTERVRREKIKPKCGDTVGCVVRDLHGKLAAGTSTGGTANKPDGRVGDAPIVGSGVYAHDQIVALSATGLGEAILGSLLSSAIVTRLRDSQGDLLEIANSELSNMRERYPDAQAGLIFIAPQGDPVFVFNSTILSVAWKTDSSQHAAVEVSENRTN